MLLCVTALPADCHKFNLGDEDYTMEQYSIFQQFQILVEHSLEEMLKEIGGDLESLVQALVKISESEATGPRDDRMKGE
jgi:hypothetical protein